MGSTSFQSAFRSVSSPRKKRQKDILVGAAAGAGAGSAIGATAGYLKARSDLAAMPEEKLSLSWKEPVWEKKLLGTIPGDYYSGARNAPPPTPAPTPVEVIREVPTYAPDGSVVMHQVEKSFTGKGSPVIGWETRPVQDCALTGQTSRVVEDWHLTPILIGFNDGVPQYMYTHTTDGYWHRHAPELSCKNAGEYSSPSVTFNSGIDVGKDVLLGLLLGMGAGAISGAILATLLKKAHTCPKQV